MKAHSLFFSARKGSYGALSFGEDGRNRRVPGSPPVAGSGDVNRPARLKEIARRETDDRIATAPRVRKGLFRA
jgi:hypothetical protein